MNESDKQVARTILQQLGGNHFIAMTGAHNLVAIESGIQLSFKGSRAANKLVIKLNGMDLYDCELWKITKKFYKKVAEAGGIYNDMLQEWFTDQTGLYTHL